MASRASIMPPTPGNDDRSSYHYQQTLEEKEKWDEFISTSRESGSASEKNTDLIQKASVALKIITIIVTFAVVLTAGVVSKGTLMFIVAQMAKTEITTCSNGTVHKLEADTVAWLW